MLKKLSFLLALAMILSGCGAAPPAESAAPASQETMAAVYEPEEPITEASSETLTAGAPAASEAEYFVFTKYSNTVTDEKDLALLYENRSIPAFISADEDRSEWVGSVLEDIGREFQTNSDHLATYAREFVAFDGTDNFYSYSNYQQMGVARHDEAVVSLISLSSLFSGGSHPNSVQMTYNLDIANRRLLRLEDVIVEDAAPELAKMVRAAVDGKFRMIDGSNGLFEDYADTIAGSMVYGNMTPYWYLNDKGLVIFYNQYELGPYAAGIIKAELPYEDLEGLLLEDYFPAEPGGMPGDLVLGRAAEGCRRIPITIESEGETLLVGVDGVVRQVQLSEVLWLEDTPIAQDLLFSALSLGQNDVLEITGGYTDDARSFAIEFIDGRGTHRIYYIHDGELSEEP